MAGSSGDRHRRLRDLAVRTGLRFYWPTPISAWLLYRLAKNGPGGWVIVSAIAPIPAATFAKRLMLPVSNNTLLRVVRRRGSPRFVPPTVIGIDDWAWRRNQRYGTIICDLERRKTIAPARSGAVDGPGVALGPTPNVSIVVRDRGGGYAQPRPRHDGRARSGRVAPH